MPLDRPVPQERIVFLGAELPLFATANVGKRFKRGEIERHALTVCAAANVMSNR